MGWGVIESPVSAPSFDGGFDGVEHHVQLVYHLAVPEALHTEAPAAQSGISDAIAGVVEVLDLVDFDDQRWAEGGEVDDVGARSGPGGGIAPRSGRRAPTIGAAPPRSGGVAALGGSRVATRALGGEPCPLSISRE